MSTSPLPLHAGSSLPAVAPAAAPPVGADMGFGQGFAQPETGVDWRRVWSAVARFKWLIAVVTILGTVGGLAATRFIKPQYMVQATLWIDQPDQRGGVDRGPIRAGQPLEPLDQVVRDQRLFLTPKAREDAPLFDTFRVADQYRPGVYRLAIDGSGRTFTLSTDKGVEVEHGAVGDSIGARLGFTWAPPAGTIPAGRTMEFSVATVRDPARSLSDELEVATDPAGNFLRMHLKGADAGRITATVNAIAERFVQVAAELRRQKLTELTKILDQQLAGAHQNLLDAEQALERFQVNTIARPSQIPKAGGTDDPAFASFFKMQVDRDQVQRDREALERVIAQAGDSGLSAEALAVVGSVQQNVQLTQALAELTTKQAELRALRYKYADAYPLVQKRLGEIATLQRQTIPNLARQLLAELSGREAELGRRVTADSRTLQAVPPRAIDEARLQRQVTLAENLYTNLKKSYDEARLAEESAVPDARILDHAVMPQDPVRNTAPRVIFLGFAASLALGLCGAVVLDRIDPKVRYPDQVSRGLGIPILGAVPHLRSRRGPARRVPEPRVRPRRPGPAAGDDHQSRRRRRQVVHRGEPGAHLRRRRAPHAADRRGHPAGRTAPPAERAPPARLERLPARRGAARRHRAGDAVPGTLADRLWDTRLQRAGVAWLAGDDVTGERPAVWLRRCIDRQPAARCRSGPPHPQHPDRDARPGPAHGLQPP